MLAFIGGLVTGGIIIGFIANRRPEWFARVVRVANIVDDKVNELAAQAKQ